MSYSKFILTNHQTVFQRATLFHIFISKCMRIPFSQNPYQRLLLFASFIALILVNVEWYLIIITCTSLITNDTENIFILLFVNHISSMKWLFKYFSFWLHYFSSHYWLLRFLNVFWMQVPFSNTCFANILSRSMVCLLPS